MLDKVIKTIIEYNMINKGDFVVVGFSGGPDSLALLHILYGMKEEYDLEIHAAHINHMIRGEEAIRDEDFSREFCKLHNIPFHLKREDVNKLAKNIGLSCEEAGRKVRYDFFNEILDGRPNGKIALAHNLNDNAETIIMRILRGSSLLGLGGINPVRDNIIRPIINCKRNEIENYCIKNNLNPVIDSTNLKEIYTRNKIRINVIPYIIENFNRKILENLNANSKIARDEEEYMRIVVEDAFKNIKTLNGYCIKGFNNLHIAMKRRVIRYIINEVLGSLNGIESKHIDMIIDLITKEESGKRIDVKKGLVCEINYDSFSIHIKSQAKEEICYNLPCKPLDINGYYIESSIVEYNDEKCKEDNVYYFDISKIKSPIVVRHRKNGDYICSKGMRGKKKLKDLFIDMKIPRHIRDDIPIVAVGSEVLIIPGIKESISYKSDIDTLKLIKIRIKGE